MNDMSPSTAVSRVAKNFSFDAAAAWVCAAVAALVLIIIVPQGGVPLAYAKSSLLAFGVLLTFILFILGRLIRGNIIVPPLALLGSLWLVPLGYALSTLFSGVNPTAGFFGFALETDTFGFVLLLAVSATLSALVLRRAGHFRIFFGVLALALSIVIVAQVGMFLYGRVLPGSLAPGFNLVGTFLDLGMVVGLGVILGLLALRFLVLPQRLKIALSIAMVLGLFVLASVNAVVLWIMVALVSLGLFIEAIMKRRVTAHDEDTEGVSMVGEMAEEGESKTNGSIVLPLVVLLVSLFFVMGNSTLGAQLTTVLGTNFADVRPSWQATFDVGSHTYAASPLFGSGPNTFAAQWVRFRDASVNDTVFWSFDFPSGIGYVPTSFVTTGIVGALMWVLFLAAFLFFGMRALLFQLPQDNFFRFVSVASFTGTLYVLALAVVMVPGPVLLMTGFVLLGVFISSLRYGKKRQEWGVVFAKSPRVGFVIVFCLTLLLLASVMGMYGVAVRYLAQQSFADASNALSRGDFVKATEAARQSNLLAPSSQAQLLTSSISLAKMNQIAGDTTLAPTTAQEQFQAALSSSVDAALTATRMDPNNYQSWALLGNVYQTVVPLNIEGAYEKAKEAYQKAIALNPTSPVLPFVLAQLEIAKGNGPLAEEQLIRAITLKRDYTQAIFLLSQLQVQEGKAREALQAAEAAAYFAPNDPSVLFQVGLLRSGNGDTAGAIAALSRAVTLNEQYANARFFLGVMYAIQKDYPKAVEQLKLIASYSEQNAAAVANDLKELEAGRNPFPPSRLGALGIPQVPVSDTVAP